MIVGEEREIESRTVSFFCLEFSGGRSLWKDKTYGEQWWTGIETVYRDVLLLHGYASPDMPEHRGITAVDVVTGELLWRNDDVTFTAAVRGTFRALVNQAGNRMAVELDRRTGAVLRGPGEGSAVAADVNDETVAGVITPVILREGADPSALTRLFGVAGIPDALTGPVEYAEIDDRMVCAYHERVPSSLHDAPRYRSVLKIMSRAQRTPLFTTPLEESVAFPAPDKFLIVGSIVLFVREHRMLTAVSLHR